MGSEGLKKACGYAVADEQVHSGMKIGLGTGSTAYFLVERVAQRMKAGELSDICAVATSFGTLNQCQELGIPVFSLNDSRIQGHLDIAIDGADEINPSNQLIKGGGGAQLLEKIIEYNADKFFVIVDESKLVETLNLAFALPLEIIPEARMAIMSTLKKMGFSAKLRMATAKVGPVVTDCGNQILDLMSPEGLVSGGPFDPVTLEHELNHIPGVVESGLFTRSVDGVYIGTEEGVQRRNPSIAD